MSDELLYLLFLFGFYSFTVVTYFALGYGITWLNERNPERKIQKGRGSDKRRKAEIRQSLASMFSACLPLTIGLYAQQKGWAPAPWDFQLVVGGAALRAQHDPLRCLVLFHAPAAAHQVAVSAVCPAS
ncbi:hypothetical protein [Sinorhizobium sp. NFACC03]|uniref:hypothetical protein n=1 Tax=Sinorhizobium sp. NFACC03 TaxID=1566295 RepID=UPI002570A9E9|nr:hypothetical protein [Sinorhizobium sp. NFACC03]